VAVTAADLDGDGAVEVLTASEGGGVSAFDRDGVGGVFVG